MNNNKTWIKEYNYKFNIKLIFDCWEETTINVYIKHKKQKIFFMRFDLPHDQYKLRLFYVFMKHKQLHKVFNLKDVIKKGEIWTKDD